MSDEIKNESAIAAGSSNANQSGPVSGQPGDTAATTVETVAKSQYDELERKLGTQGNELGEFKDYFKEVEPLLAKLDSNPELVRAILDDKISPDLIKGALEGKITVKDATDVTTAHSEVKKEIGKKYESLSPDQITELVENKVKENTEKLEKKFQTTFSEAEQLSNYKGKVESFIKNTEDFPEYAVAIDAWFDEHPDQDNINIAYDAVKGKALAEKNKKNGIANEGDAKKDVAANAGGGDSLVSGKMNIDGLATMFRPQSNPNVF